MWFGENYKSEGDSSEEDNLNPETMKLDRPLSLQQVQIIFNHFLMNKDLLSSKTGLIRLERTVSVAHMQIRDSQTILSSLNEIMNYLVRNIDRLSTDNYLVSPLLELFLQIQYRANQEVEYRDTQMIEVHNTQSIEVRGRQKRNENPYREMCEKYKVAQKIEILNSMNHRVYREGISKRRTEKNRKVREKKKEKERDEAIQRGPELPCKRRNCEEMELDMQEVCKKVKDDEEFPKGWLMNEGFLDDEKEDGEVIHDKYGDLDLQDEIRIFESDTELPEEGPQDQEGFKLHEEVKLPQYYERVISPLDQDKETAKSSYEEGIYKSSLDHEEESKLPQYQYEAESIIKLDKTESSEESDSGEEISILSHSESELPDSLHDEAQISSWYIVSNEELSSYQGRNNDMIIPESICLSRFPF
jgi:hypothetical protein